MNPCNHRSLTCSLILLFAVSAPVFATTREVGSGLAYGTITAALAAAASGDTINVHAGNYAENIGTYKTGLVIKNNTGDAPCIIGSISIGPGANNTTIDGFEIKGWTGSGVDGSGIKVNASGVSTLTSGTSIKNCKIHAGSAVSKTSPTIDTNGLTSVLSCGIFLRNHAKTTITNVEIYGCVTGMYAMACKSTDGTFGNGTIISNANIHDCPSDGIDLVGQYITIQDSNIHDNVSTQSGGVVGGGAAPGYHSDGVQGINNTGSTGTVSTNGTGCVQHVRILRNTWGNATQNIFIEGPNANGSSFSTSPYVVVDVLIANNVIYTSPDGTVIHGIDAKNLAAKGILQKYASNFSIYNNTIINQGIGINPSGYTFLKNNIIKQCRTGIYAPNVSKNIAAGALDYNVYYGNGNVANWNNTWYASLSAFRAAVPIQEAHGMSGDPKLSSLPRPTLQTGSSAIGTSVNLSPYCPLDREKNLRNISGAWDTGAYAYSVGLAPPTNLTVVP